jgi:RND family efflux transporter MFP subunit
VAVADALELDWVVTRMNSKSSNRLNAIAASFAIASASLLLSTGCDSHMPAQTASAATTENATTFAKPAVPANHAQDADPADPKSFTTTGPLVAEQQADISAERDGRIVNIAVIIGDRVRQGQLLAVLDDRALHSACDAQQARIASAKAQVNEWEAEELTARADLRRADLMRADKIISEEAWEHAKYRVDETVAEVSHFRDEQVAAEADFKTADLQLEQSRIVAPFAGVVGRSSARSSQQVKAGDVLFWITAESPLQVIFTVPETAMAAFSIGKPLELTTVDYPGMLQMGRISRVSPVVDPASSSVQVIGALIHPSPKLKPGMSMQVRLAQ